MMEEEENVLSTETKLYTAISRMHLSSEVYSIITKEILTFTDTTFNHNYLLVPDSSVSNIILNRIPRDTC